MGRFYGAVGYGETVETSPGVWEIQHHTRMYYGDVLKKARQFEKGDGLNDDIKVTNRISIIADEYAYTNIFAMRYVVWMGTKWKIKDAEVERPRIILSLGGVYNGNGNPSETP